MEYADHFSIPGRKSLTSTMWRREGLFFTNTSWELSLPVVRAETTGLMGMEEGCVEGCSSPYGEKKAGRSHTAFRVLLSGPASSKQAPAPNSMASYSAVDSPWSVWGPVLQRLPGVPPLSLCDTK